MTQQAKRTSLTLSQLPMLRAGKNFNAIDVDASKAIKPEVIDITVDAIESPVSAEGRNEEVVGAEVEDVDSELADNVNSHMDRRHCHVTSRSSSYCPEHRAASAEANDQLEVGAIGEVLNNLLRSSGLPITHLDRYFDEHKSRPIILFDKGFANGLGRDEVDSHHKVFEILAARHWRTVCDNYADFVAAVRNMDALDRRQATLRTAEQATPIG
ncbi:uncharacterized protein BJ212DRAFT_108716 [Suillus subaureus]|uniref:Uncharacterized protein n=1 Tax=Suillus subaureus TaxID=48587 RepID=A0A9P7EEL9_9AGAM|nr:uncharacterized protein BJ212DRAFT_108716 [Suillus subaureus]KAG1818755.1 hypothetical protein BJ212DRAFT_108716 [Suillus subaureus]